MQPTPEMIAEFKERFPTMAAVVTFPFRAKLPPGNLAPFFGLSDAAYAEARRYFYPIVKYIEDNQPTGTGVQHWRRRDPSTTTSDPLGRAIGGGAGVPVASAGGYGYDGKKAACVNAFRRARLQARRQR